MMSAVPRIKVTEIWYAHVVWKKASADGSSRSRRCAEKWRRAWRISSSMAGPRAKVSFEYQWLDWDGQASVDNACVVVVYQQRLV